MTILLEVSLVFFALLGNFSVFSLLVDGFIVPERPALSVNELHQSDQVKTTTTKNGDGGDVLLPCDAKFKVFVYNISSSGLMDRAFEARRNVTFHVCKKCIYEQFALEYVVYDYFTQFCGRTYDPEDADFFYLPVIREIDYRIALQTGQRAPSVIEEALLEAVEDNNTTKWKSTFLVTDKYWRRHKGADHIIAMAAPVTNFRHQSNMRGFFHYMVQLFPPIFLNVEFSRSFINEYPVCASAKNIVMPYPSTDPDLISGRLFSNRPPRDKLVFYQGGNHGSCSFIRSALQEIIQNKKYALQRGPQKREFGFQSSVFCPIPVGDSPSSKRMYDVMNFGCIPVIISDDLVWAYSNETGGFLDPSTFSIHLPQSIVQLSATKLISDFLKQDSDVNFGRMLPSSGISIYRLLMDVAAEEEAKAQVLAQSNSSSSSIAANAGAMDGNGRRLGSRRRKQQQLQQQQRLSEYAALLANPLNSRKFEDEINDIESAWSENTRGMLHTQHDLLLAVLQRRVLNVEEQTESYATEWREDEEMGAQAAAAAAANNNSNNSYNNSAETRYNNNSTNNINIHMMGAKNKIRKGNWESIESELLRAVSSCALSADATTADDAFAFLSEPNSFYGSSGSSHRSLLQQKQKPKPKPKPSTVASPERDSAWTVAGGGINTLIRLLEKIPTKDISLLQEGVRNASRWYRYYQFDMTLPAAAPALTAGEHGNGRYTDGGAVAALEYQLAKRKASGDIDVVAKQCEVERARKHKYIGRYPCTKYIT